MGSLSLVFFYWREEAGLFVKNERTGWLNWQMLNSPRSPLLSALPLPSTPWKRAMPIKLLTKLQRSKLWLQVSMFRSTGSKNKKLSVFCDGGSWKLKCTMCSCVDAGLLVRKRKISVRPLSLSPLLKTDFFKCFSCGFCVAILCIVFVLIQVN